ncbi:MAG TPA: Crp/Fnr family transcriptional regulator [Bacilli bacterium]
MHKKETIRQLIPLFKDLTPQEMDYVDQITIQRHYRKRSVIFSEGGDKESVFFIEDGLVKTYKTDENGNEQIVSFLKTGDMFPHTGFFNSNPYPATAEALVDSKLLAIPVHSFEQLMVSTPTIAVKVMRVMGAKIQELQVKLQELTGQDVQYRALSFLLKLAAKHGKPEGSALRIDLPMTNQEFANAIGTTRETVNRMINSLRKAKIIELDRNEIVILNLEALKDWR